MALTSDLVAEFAKATNDTAVTKAETYMYGTVVEKDGKPHVRLDGSDILTPIVTTTNVSPGERVPVMIKNHVAAIMGNFTAPSARSTDVQIVRSELMTDIKINEEAISTKVSQEDFDALGQTVNSNSSTFEQTAKEIRTEVADEVEGLQTQITQNAEGIKLVANRTVGATQLLRDTKRLTIGTDANSWRSSNISKAYVYENESGFWRMILKDSGQTADTWVAMHSPLVRLPDNWTDKKVTLSAWIWSSDWAGMDAGENAPIAWTLNLSQGGTTRLNYGSKYGLVKPGEVSFGDDVTSDSVLSNSKWIRISTTFTLNSTNMSGGSGTFASNTHMFASFFLRRNGEYRIYAPKLEFGDISTDWSAHPEELNAGSSVRINEREVSVSTEIFNVNISSEDGSETMLSIDEMGANAKSLAAPDVTPRYSGATTLYVDPNATDTQLAAGNYFRSLSNALSKINYRWITSSITINLAEGITEYGTLQIRGNAGNGTITINGNNSKLVGRIYIYLSGVPVTIDGLNVDVPASGYGYDIGNGTVYANIKNCIITGTGTGWGVRVMHGAAAVVNNCELYDLTRSLYTQYGGRLHGADNKGNSVVASAQGGYMTLTGTQPCNSTTWASYTATAGQVFTDKVTVDQGSKPTADPEPTTVTINAAATDTYTPSQSFWISGVLRQGYTDSVGMLRACMWFNSTDISALSGKTVKQASMRLTRNRSHGASYGVSVKLYGTTMSSSKTGAPALSKSYGLVVANSDTDTTLGLVWNETESFTIPTAAINDLVSGDMSGLMLVSDDDHVWSSRLYSRNYAQFLGVSESTSDTIPMLTVSYV